MSIQGLRTALILAGAVAGLASVSPALSSKDPAPATESVPARIADTMPRRPSKSAARPARVAQGAEPGVCTSARRSLWVEGEGWIVRRVSICR